METDPLEADQVTPGPMGGPWSNMTNVLVTEEIRTEHRLRHRRVRTWQEGSQPHAKETPQEHRWNIACGPLGLGLPASSSVRKSVSAA